MPLMSNIIAVYKGIGADTHTSNYLGEGRGDRKFFQDLPAASVFN